MVKKEDIKKEVRKGYAIIAKQESSCCAPAKSCCGSVDLKQDISKKIGYTEEELSAVPEGANLELGCGNPVALASLREGEIVLDLGSGAGFDCFLAASKVGKNGRVIGVDMTPEMVEKARENARKSGYENVEFRLGEIENLNIEDNFCDIVISNCVINLSPDKEKAFKEAYRVLKPGGRLMISDIVLLKELPDFIKNSIEAYIGCLSGAILKDDYLQIIKETGFENVEIIDESPFPFDFTVNNPTAKVIIGNQGLLSEKVGKISDIVSSIKVSGIKPIRG